MIEAPDDDHPASGQYWATDLPLLKPSMLLPWRQQRPRAFPFSHPNVEYVHFARNAIFALAKHFELVGADVLVPAYFHGVEIEALVAAGVRPRFYPVHSGMRVDANDVLQCIRPETRAVYLIHYLGFPGPALELEQMCRERGVIFIEDCALALLSADGDRPLGSSGDAAVFCLYKTLPTVDGGAVLLREGKLRMEGSAPPVSGTARELAVSLLKSMERGYGSVGQGAIRAVKRVGKRLARSTDEKWVPVGTQDFNSDDANLLMSRVSKSVLAAQDLPRIVETRRRNYQHLESLLRDLAPPVFWGLAAGVCPLFYPFATARKRELWRELDKRGVQSVLFWFPRQFAPPRGEFPEVDELRETVLELPCHQDLTSGDIERMAHIVRECLQNLEPHASA